MTSKKTQETTNKYWFYNSDLIYPETHLDIKSHEMLICITPVIYPRCQLSVCTLQFPKALGQVFYEIHSDSVTSHSAYYFYHACQVHCEWGEDSGFHFSTDTGVLIKDITWQTRYIFPLRYFVLTCNFNSTIARRNYNIFVMKPNGRLHEWMECPTFFIIAN